MTQLSYRMDKKDLQTFMQHFSNTSPAVKQAQTGKAAVVAIAFLIVYLFPREEWPEPVYMVMSFFIGLFIVTWISRRKPKISLKKIDAMYPPEKHPGMFGEHVLELAEDCLVEKSDAGEQHSKYETLQKVERTNSHTFIFLTDFTAHVIPHDKISEGSLEEFLNVLKERVDKTHA